MQREFSTDELPKTDRFDGWADVLWQEFGIVAKLPPERPADFSASIRLRSSRAMWSVSFSAEAHWIERADRGIARQPWDAYMLYRETRAGTWYRQAGREFIARAGEVVILDADAPFAKQPPGSYRNEAVLLPKALLDPHLPRLARPLSVSLCGRPGLDALATTYLDAVMTNWDGLQANLTPVADTLARLIAVACGSAAGAQPEAVQAGRLVEAKTYVGGHLADPGLSPAGVAAALGISLRALHLLFEPSGSSFGRYVMRRRLEECRCALLADPTRPVLDIAFAWGFSSLSSFYRAFKTSFELSPGDLREMPSHRLDRGPR